MVGFADSYKGNGVFGNGGFGGNDIDRQQRSFTKKQKASGFKTAADFPGIFRSIFDGGVSCITVFYDLFQRNFLSYFHLFPCAPIDRVVHQVVPFFFLGMALVIGGDRFFGFAGGQRGADGTFGKEAMSCLPTMDFKPGGNSWGSGGSKDHPDNGISWEWVNNYCASASLYYVPVDSSLPYAHSSMPSFLGSNVVAQPKPSLGLLQIGYYHWIGYIFIIMALAPTIPGFVWKHCSNISGLEYATWVERAKDFPPEMEEKNQKEATNDLCQRIYARLAAISMANNQTTSTWIIYVLIKLLSTFILMTMIAFMNWTVGSGFFSGYGWEVLMAFYTGKPLQEKPIFSRIVYCRLPYRFMEDSTYKTVQCHLRVVAFIEKIYFIVSILLPALTFIVFCDFSYYLYQFVIFKYSDKRLLDRIFPMFCSKGPFFRVIYAYFRHRHEEGSKMDDKKMLVRETVEKYAELIGMDGLLLFWFLKTHVGTDVAARICEGVFYAYLESEGKEEAIMEALGLKLDGVMDKWPAEQTNNGQEEDNDDYEEEEEN